MADVFLKEDVRKHFRGKKVIFLGDSIMRNIYQDFVYLLEKGDLTPHGLLRKKGEQIQSFEGDELLPGTGVRTTGRNYKEIREYRGSRGPMQDFMFATYYFLTKCYSGDLEDFILRFKRRHGSPDLILILSALWDINRWGPDGIPNYIKNCRKFLTTIKNTFSSSTQLIWLTSPPISVEIWGGFLVKGMEFAKRSMRFNVMEGNLMVAQTTAAFGFDVVDLHYWMTHQIHKRMPDGIHWTQDAVRLQLNIILTHFCLARKIPLPGRWGGARNRPLESAEMIAKAADEGPVEIVKEDGVKRKNRDNDDEPPTKKVKVGDTIDGHSYPRQNKTTEREELKSKDRSDYEETAKMVRLGESDVGRSDSGHEKSREREGENKDGGLKSFSKHERQRAELGLSAKEVRQQRWSGQ